METIYFYFNNGGDKDKLIPNLGDVGWTSFSSSFHGCGNLGTVAGGNTSNVTDMSSMFYQAASAIPVVGIPPVLRIWRLCFLGLSLPLIPEIGIPQASRRCSVEQGWTPDTSNWDTSNVTRCHRKLILLTPTPVNSGALLTDIANPDTSNWDTSALTDMSWMFHSPMADPNTSTWDTSNVGTMHVLGGFFRAAPDHSPV